MKRINAFLALTAVGLGLLIIATFIGAGAGITQLDPIADWLRTVFDAVSLGVVIAVVIAIAGLVFLRLGLRALFRRSKKDG